MNTERIDCSTWRPRIGWTGVALGLLSWIAGCSSDSDSGFDSFGPPGITPSAFVVSDPVTGAAPASASGAGASVVGSQEVATLAYVSLAEDQIPGGTSASIRNWRTGTTVITPMVAGGFDPVAVEASAGDTLEIGVALVGASSALSFLVRVPATAPPIVVRTEPSDGKRDVPLNARIVIVFSEPIDPATLTGTTVQLKRGLTGVTGTVQFTDTEQLTAEFVPDEPLAPDSDYELLITQEIEDLDGEALSKSAKVSFTTGAGDAVSAPTGQIAFVGWGSDDVQHIFLLDLDQATVTQLTSGAAFDFAPTWSPDRTKIAFARGVLGDSADSSMAGTWLMNADGSGAVRRSGLAGDPSWSPDGAKLAILTSNSMWILDATTFGTDVKVLDSIPGLILSESPAWSPDGATIAFEGTILDLGGDVFTQVYFMDSDGANVRPLPPYCSNGECARFAGNGPAWSPDGARLAFWTFDYGITVIDRDGGGVFSVTHDGMAISHSEGPATGYDAHPSWSPDGQWLVFQSPGGGLGQLVVARADGTGEPVTVTNLPRGASSPAWSRH